MSIPWGGDTCPEFDSVAPDLLFHFASLPFGNSCHNPGDSNDGGL